MKTYKLILQGFIGLALIAAISACSTANEPHLGETTSKIEENGVTVYKSDDRRLLPSGKLAGSESALVEAKAKVTNINYPKRSMTVRTPEGKFMTMQVGNEVRNFSQIQTGDEVMIEYYLSVEFEAREPTQAEMQMANKAMTFSTRANRGEKPGAIAAGEVISVVTIESIDKQKQLVVLKGADGGYSTVKAKYPENLRYISEGDKVVVTLTEALAARVTRM